MPVCVPPFITKILTALNVRVTLLVIYTVLHYNGSSSREWRAVGALDGEPVAGRRRAGGARGTRN